MVRTREEVRQGPEQNPSRKTGGTAMLHFPSPVPDPYFLQTHEDFLKGSLLSNFSVWGGFWCCIQKSKPKSGGRKCLK